jgi:hypothetical protein
MRFRLLALLGILMLCLSFFSTARQVGHGQSAQVASARSGLIQAFILVLEADQDGASSAQVSQLSDNLNLALSLEENASRFGSNLYAGQSLALSNSTAVQALSFASAARAQSVSTQASSYSLAVAAGFGSALLVLEFHRIDNIARKVRSRRLRME